MKSVKPNGEGSSSTNGISINEARRWRWIDLVAKVLAIVAPFVLAFLVLQTQIVSQRVYDKDKLLQLLYHIDLELAQNLHYITDSVVVAIGYDELLLKNPKSREIRRAQLSLVRFRTTVWQTANTKDYFFLIKQETYYKLEEMYRDFEEANAQLDVFDQDVHRIMALTSDKSVDLGRLEMEYYLHKTAEGVISELGKRAKVQYPITARSLYDEILRWGPSDVSASTLDSLLSRAKHKLIK